MVWPVHEPAARALPRGCAALRRLPGQTGRPGRMNDHTFILRGASDSWPGPVATRHDWPRTTWANGPMSFLRSDIIRCFRPTRYEMVIDGEELEMVPSWRWLYNWSRCVRTQTVRPRRQP